MKCLGFFHSSRLDRDVFFYHLPKTAGTTLQVILGSGFRQPDICPAHNWTELLAVDPQITGRYKLFMGHFYGGLDQFLGRDLYTFTMLRDPIERALSHYGHILRDPSHYLHHRAVELGSLDAYLKDPIARLTVSNFQTRLLALKSDPQAIFRNFTDSQRKNWALERKLETMELHISDNQMLEEAQARLSQFGVVGLTECFEETVALLCHEMGWDFPAQIAYENVNRARPKQAQISNSALSLLTELNQLDHELYHWAEVIFRQRICTLFATLLKCHRQGLLPKFTKTRSWKNS
jgi:hypothetical protein